MIAGILALVVFATAPAKPGNALEKRSLEKATVDEFLTAATALTLDRSLDEAQRSIDVGRARFPAAQGFHLKQGDLHVVRGRVADAFYEYLWEVMRAGDNDTGSAAARAIGRLIKEGSRGAETDEIQQVLLAQANLMVKSRDALESLRKVQELRGKRFALRMLIAEAQVVAGELDAAESEFRALIAEDKFFVPAYVELAGVLRLKGKPKDAGAMHEKARAMYPDHPSFTSPERPDPPPAR